MAEYASLYHDHPKDMQVKKNYIHTSHPDMKQPKLNNEILKGRANDVDGRRFSKANCSG